MHWPGIPTLLLGVVVLANAAPNLPFENTAIVRTVELGGSLVHVTTTYAVKALKSNRKSYTISMSKKERERTGWMEVKLKGQQDPLLVEETLDADTEAYMLTVQLPSALALNASTNIVVETAQTRATYPWPDKIAQNEEQRLKYDAELFVTSPYHTAVQRTKIKAPSPRVLSYTEPAPEIVDKFSTEKTASTKSGATITYGPYSNIPPSATREFASGEQSTVTVHYHYDYPVIEVLSMERSAEISHWGANLNIEDKIHLRNGGPELKGHFSRLEHTAAQFYKRGTTNTISGLILHLPAGIQNTYYYDQIGNVSTSHLRVASPPASPKARAQYSILEMRPRYPLMGGWNYTYTLGWDAPLEHSSRYDAQTGRYLVQIPMMTFISGSCVDDAKVKIILPEGATDIEHATSYQPLKTTTSTHVTYLDTIGRPAITFEYKDLTDKHAYGVIYVTYKVPFTAHLRKPFAVTVAFASLFALAYGVKRVDLRLNKQKVY